MKPKLILILVLSALMISGCLLSAGKSTVDYPATIAALSVEATINAIERADLQAEIEAFANQPTPTCPACPTPEPQPPTATATPELPTPTPVPTQAPTGSLSGALSYPSSHIPPLRLVAFNIHTGYYYWQNTALNQMSYKFTDLPAGKYHVLAYLLENPSPAAVGAYSKAVICGLDASCNDHSLVDVEVKSNQETTGVSVQDWYANPVESGWPKDPTR